MVRGWWVGKNAMREVRGWAWVSLGGVRGVLLFLQHGLKNAGIEVFLAVYQLFRYIGGEAM